ncbi:MAG: glycosyltransferase [Phycisphaera sp.]|nr:glycosyltransferase [Phycisphaera sp.]
MKILYVGDGRSLRANSTTQFIASTCHHRMTALKELGHEVVHVDTNSDRAIAEKNSLPRKILRRITGRNITHSVNREIVACFKQQTFDVMWVDKGIGITADTLDRCKKLRPQTVIVHYNPDDPFGRWRGKFWTTFLEALPLYDLHLVPRLVNVDEYLGAGAKRARHILPFWGFNPDIHHAFAISPEERERLGGEVGFVGAWEQERIDSLRDIAEKGLPVRVWCWEKNNTPMDLPTLRFEGRGLWGEDYAKAISAFDISVAFLRKGNRDKHTSRSIEIPACRGFMLAERTDEHQALFQEGKEAEFFDSNEELLDKARYYLQHADERKKIAQNGYQRCLDSGYSNAQRMRHMLGVATNSERA